MYDSGGDTPRPLFLLDLSSFRLLYCSLILYAFSAWLRGLLRHHSQNSCSALSFSDISTHRNSFKHLFLAQKCDILTSKAFAHREGLFLSTPSRPDLTLVLPVGIRYMNEHKTQCRNKITTQRDSLEVLVPAFRALHPETPSALGSDGEYYCARFSRH